MTLSRTSRRKVTYLGATRRAEQVVGVEVLLEGCWLSGPMVGVCGLLPAEPFDVERDRVRGLQWFALAH